MSETKSQPTPVTDKAEKNLDRELLQYSLGGISEFPTFKTMRSLEISRDQWKAVAERLADALKLTKGKWTFSSGQVHTHTWHDWADCIVPVTESLTAYNNLKNPTK